MVTVSEDTPNVVGEAARTTLGLLLVMVTTKVSLA
jgi:hypothetical protein